MEKIIACSYSRVSREDQIKNDGPTIKLSLENQKQKAEEMAAEKGWEYLRDYREEGITGEELEIRPQLMKLLQDARAGLFNLVIIRHQNRIGRRQFIYHYVMHTLEVECRVQVLNLDNQQPIVPPNQFFPSRDNSRVYRRGIEGMLTESESNSRVMLLEVGRRNQVLKGRYIGSRRPFGYRIEERINSGKVERIPVPDPNEYWVLKAMYKWYVEDGLTLGEITARLHKEKISTVSGRPWSIQVVKQMLDNPFYAGKLTYGVERNNLGLPAIEAEHRYEHPWKWEQYQLVQERRSRSKKIAPRSLGHSNNPVSGLVFCGRCQNKMSVTTYNLKPTKKEIKTVPQLYLRCWLHNHNRAACEYHSVSLNKFLGVLWLKIDALVGEITEQPNNFLKKVRSEGLLDLKNELALKRKTKEAELARLETQKGNLDMALLNGLSVQDYERIKNSLGTQIGEVEEALFSIAQGEVELAGKEVKLENLNRFADHWQTIRSLLSQKVELWDTELLRAVKSQLRLIISRIELIGSFDKAKVRWHIDAKITWNLFD